MVATGLRVSGRLIVSGFECSIEEISAILGTEPTDKWIRQSAVSSRAERRHEDNAWILAAPVDPLTTEPAGAVAALLAVFTNVGVFQKLPEGVEVTVSLAVTGLDTRPGFDLPAAIILKLGEVGASLDVDIYDFSDIRAANRPTSSAE